MKILFYLEIFYEVCEDEEFAKKEAIKLKTLVKKLAPHIKLVVKVSKASRICLEGKLKLPSHDPTEEGYQTLLITYKDLKREKKEIGWGWPGKGCLSKQAMELKGEDSADITIHEWLHTITGKELNRRKIPSPDTKCKFAQKDKKCRWYPWYRYLLREYPWDAFQPG